MKYKWGNRSYEVYKPKVNRVRQVGLISFFLTAISADLIIPCTFGQITKGAYKISKLNLLFLYK